MISFIYIFLLARIVLSNCYVLVSSFNENDVVFVTHMANFLVSKGVECRVFVPDTVRDLILVDERIKILTFKNNVESTNTLEEEWSEPVPQSEVSKLLKACESFVQEKSNIVHILNDPPSSVIIPSFLHDACFLPLVAYLNSKAVKSPSSKEISTFVWTSNYLSDSWAYYHLTSSIIPTDEVKPGTFSRVKNFFNWWLFLREINGGYVDPAIEILKSNLNKFENYIEDYHQSLPDMYENRVNLTLVGTHPLFTPPTPMAVGMSPFTVNIGCFYCRTANPLPKDLEEHITIFRAGAVIIESDFKFKIPITAKRAIVEAGRALPYSIFWQTSDWENENEVGPSESLLIRKTLPLQDLLGHPKCRIFVSRCSMESVLIATYHGVPIICLPVTHFDESVASYVEKHGIGVILQRKNITGKLLANAISGVANNPGFRGIARHLAETLRDQPETPGDRFIFAIQNLERHREHNHYSHLKRQNFFNTHHWDICVALTVVVVLILICLGTCVWFVSNNLSNDEETLNVDSKKII